MTTVRVIIIIVLILLKIKGNAQHLQDTIIPLNEIIIKETILLHPLNSKNCNLDVVKYPVSDVGNYLKTTAGIAGVRKGSVSLDPVVRGFRANQINIVLNDAIKIEGGCPNRMDPVTSHIEAEDVHRIDIIKGPFVLRYGPSIGGTINMITLHPETYEKFEIHTRALYGFETNWNGQREHLTIYGGNKKLLFSCAGGYKYFGNYTAGNDKKISSSFKKYNYNASVGFYPAKNHLINLGYFENHGRDVSYPALPMDEVSDDTRILSMKYNWNNISDKMKLLTVSLYHADVFHVMDNSRRANYSTMQAKTIVDALNTGGRTELSMLLNKSLFLNVGADYEQIYKDGTKTMNMIMTMNGLTTVSTKKSNIWLNAVIQNTALFAEIKKNAGNFNYIISARGDYNHSYSEDTLVILKSDADYFSHQKSKFINISGSLAAAYIINSSLSLKLILGRGVRSPNMLERYIKYISVGYDNYDYIGNPLLKPETNYQSDMIITYHHDIIGKFYLNGFYSCVFDFISGKKLPPSVAMPSTQGALGVKQFTNLDKVYLRGFEFGYTYPVHTRIGMSVMASYTQAFVPVTTRYSVENKQVVDEKEIKNDPLPEIPPLEGTLKIFYNLLNNSIQPELAYRFVAAQNFVSAAF